MKSNKMPDINYLRTILDYDQNTGHLTRKFKGSESFTCNKIYKMWLTRFYGKPAEQPHKTRSGKSYYRVLVEGKRYMARIIAWAIYYGQWPILEIDHLSGDGTDNRISNLREVTKQENAKNRRMNKNNSSSVTGVRLFCYFS